MARVGCVLIILFLVVGIALVLTAASTEPLCEQVTQYCIAGHVRDVLALKRRNTSSADDEYDLAVDLVSGFVDRCMDGGGRPSGQAFRPLRLLNSRYASAPSGTAHMASEFEEATGWKIIIDDVDFQESVNELVFAENNAPLTYDGWIADAATVVDVISNTAMLGQIDSFIQADAALNWPDVLNVVRTISSTYAGNVVGVPMAGQTFHLYYRKDVFAMAGLTSAPTTWKDVVLAAKMLNGSDFNRDGSGDHALCFQLGECIDGQVLSLAMLASMTQRAGPKTGYLVDPQTMQSFVGSAAMEATIGLLQEMMRHSAPGCGPGLISPYFMSGACAMTISTDTLFKVIQLNSPIRDAVGVVNLPGSLRVLNRQIGGLEECTLELCPYAKLQRTYDGRTRRVNQVQFGTGGVSGFINARQDPVYQQAMYDFFSFVSQPTRSKQRVIGTSPPFAGAFRKSHLDTAAASLAEWRAAGYNQGAVKEFLEMMQSGADDPNFALTLRMRGGSSLYKAFGPAVLNASVGMAPAIIAANLAAEYDAILARSGPIDDVRASLWAGLGIPLPTPPAPPQTVAPPISGSDGGPQLGLILGVTIPVSLVLLLLALIALFVVMRHSKRLLFGRPYIPAAGKDTTLVVTDIMDSTALWEALDAGTMTRAVATHHSVVRKWLAHFHGYEQATEGDSFLLAFHTPSDALGFAVELQAGLLAADWDPELLAHPSCTPMTMVQSAVSAGGNDGRFHLRSAPAVLLGEGEGLGGRPSARFSSKTNFARISDVGALMTMPRRHSHSRNAHGAAMVSRGAIAAALLVRGIMDGERGAASPPTSGPLAPVERVVSEVVRIAAGAGRSSGTFGAAPPSGEPDADKAGDHSFPGGDVSRTGSILVCKGSALENQRLSVLRGAESDWAAHPGSPARDARGFQMEHAMALFADVQATTSASEGATHATRNTASMAEYMRLVFGEDNAADARAPMSSGQAAVVFRGLRVRVGMHSGVAKTDVERNTTAGRMFFTGMPLALAKAVGDAGAGGMVLLTQDAFERLRPDRALSNVLVLCIGDHVFKDDGLKPVCLYQAIERPLVPRLAAFEALRNVEKLQLSVLDAPLGNNVAVVFVNMVGMSSLQAWDKDQAARALSVFVALSNLLLVKAGGYLVELTSAGICLAAFREPTSAVAWGLCLIEVMKHAEWDEELLAHELCEEVLVLASAPASQQLPRGVPAAHSVLFRGPRLKIGIDVGHVQADVSPVTGRMSYRGKVMNRAARICAKASSGMQWCSAAVWDQVVSKCGEHLPSILGTELGAFNLKGIPDSVHLVQNALGGGSAPMAATPEVKHASRIASFDTDNRHTHSSLARTPSVVARAALAPAGLPARVGDTSLRCSHVLSIPVAAANRIVAYGGYPGLVGCGCPDEDEEDAAAKAAMQIAAAAKRGVSPPVCLATDVVRFLHEMGSVDTPAGGGGVSASFLNAKQAVGGIGVEPCAGGVLRVLFTVASDAVADVCTGKL
ncbi:hypothetical protein FOA52_009774 [Chlamydomonas sp. UWO 241]|nr:hypothetical protein FOA52_009774 [Chlamydomonas sp. UWO 241]